MVNLARDITAAIAHTFRLSSKDFQKLIKETIKDYRNKTLDEILKEMEKIFKADEKKRKEKAEKSTAKVPRHIITQNMVQNVRYNPYAANIDNMLDKLKVILIKPVNQKTQQLIKKQKFLDDDLDDSESIINLAISLKKNFRPVFGDTRDIQQFRDNVYETILKFFPQKEYADKIYDSLNIFEFEVKKNISYLLYYVSKNSSYRDYGDLIVQRFCTENYVDRLNETKLDPSTGLPQQFGCFFRCCLKQAPKFFQLKKNFNKLCYLDKIYNGKANHAIMEEVAQEFKLNVIVLNIVLKTRIKFEYADKLTADKKNIIVVEKDEHVYSFNPELNKQIRKCGENNSSEGFNHLIHNSMKQNTHIKPITEKNNNPFLKNIFKINKHEKIKLIFKNTKKITEEEEESETEKESERDDDSSDDSGGSDNKNTATATKIIKDIIYKNKSILLPSSAENTTTSQQQINVYYLKDYDDLLYIYHHYRTTYGILGHIKENTVSGNYELKIKDEKNNTFYFRTREFIYFDDLYDPQHTFSYSSLSKYLFRKFITEPIKKNDNFIINQVYKSMCTPLIKLFYDCGKNDEKIKYKYYYYYDLNKAYFNSSRDLHIPENYVLYNFEGDRDEKEVEEKKKKEPTDEEKKDRDVFHAFENDIPFNCYFCKKEYTWKWTHNYTEIDKQNILAYIPVKKETTNVVREFGESIKSNKFLKEDYKRIFNVLIGSMQPSDLTKAISIYFHNELDFCDFILDRDKKIINIDIDEDFKLFKVQFIYENASTIHQSFDLNFFSAQIIQRCRSKVFSMKEYIESNHDAKVLMCMTDSCIIGTNEKIELPFNLREEWDMKCNIGNRINIRGLGNYCIWDSDENVVYATKSYGQQQQEQLQNDDNDSHPEEEICDNKFCPSSSVTIIKGSAGCGKTRYVKQKYWDKDSGNFVIMGSTGVSANNLNTKTFHSFFGFKTSDMAISEGLARMKRENIIKIKNCETIVIDEAFMLRDSDIEKMNIMLKYICCNSNPFGGKKIVLVGDEAQLAPVGGVNSYFDSDNKNISQIIEIPYDEENSRMKKDYKEWTDKFRNFSLYRDKKASFDKIMEQGKKLFNQTGFKDTLTVFFKNEHVDSWNETARKNPVTIEEGEPLLLKKNKKIERGLFNGKIGKCKIIKNEKTGQDEKFFVCDNGKGTQKETKYNLENLKYKEDYDLAYAVTIHKSQGLTLEGGINIGYTYSISQLRNDETIFRLMYVALTRVRDFDKVYLF